MLVPNERLLVRQHASTKAMGCFYQVVEQSILLYGSESWALTAQQLHLLDSFHHHCMWHITHRHIQPPPNGTWITPASTEVLQEAGPKPISTYIQKHREHVTEFATNLLVYALCNTSKSAKAAGSHTYWWLLPNDVINPLDTPTTLPSPATTLNLYNRNRHRNHPSRPHYNCYTPRPHTVLLNTPAHPMYHTTYHSTPMTITTPSDNSTTTLPTGTTTTNTPATHNTTHPCSLLHPSIIPCNYDHELISHTSTNPDMTWQQMLDIPLPPPPTPYDHLHQTPPKPSSIAPPPQVDTYIQEYLLPNLLDPDDFFLPDISNSDYDADSNTSSNSDSLASNVSFPSLQSYGKLDDLDDLNFSDLDEDIIHAPFPPTTGLVLPMRLLPFQYS